MVHHISLTAQGNDSLKKDCFMWRAYIAQHKYRVVLDGITDSPSTPNGLKAIRKVAEYFNAIGEQVLSMEFFSLAIQPLTV